MDAHPEGDVRVDVRGVPAGAVRAVGPHVREVAARPPVAVAGVEQVVEELLADDAGASLGDDETQPGDVAREGAQPARRPRRALAVERHAPAQLGAARLPEVPLDRLGPRGARGARAHPAEHVDGRREVAEPVAVRTVGHTCRQELAQCRGAGRRRVPAGRVAVGLDVRSGRVVLHEGERRLHVHQLPDGRVGERAAGDLGHEVADPGREVELAARRERAGEQPGGAPAARRARHRAAGPRPARRRRAP